MAVARRAEVQPELAYQSRSWQEVVGSSIRKNPVGAFAGIVCLILIVIAIGGPNLAPYSPNANSFALLQAPSLAHPLGTDNVFRDLSSRIIFGARNSLGIGFSAIAVSLVIGIALGVLSGFLGGIWDMFTTIFVDVMFSYPSLVLVIFCVTVFGQNFATISVAIGLILTPYTIRVVRSATLSVRSLQYIEAARAVGNSSFRIMYRHVLPNIMPYIIVVASVNIGLAILIEAALSFLGLGISSDTNPSWGRMLQETRPYWQQAWWTAVVPGAAISFAVLSFNIFGDALRDWLDPRLRGSR